MSIMNTYNNYSKQKPWVSAGKQLPDIETTVNLDLAFYGGGTGGDTGKEPESTDEREQEYADKSVIDKMNARRGSGDSTKADSGGGNADKRVVSRDVDSGPVNNDRGA
jgi:hypothetical protein